MTRSRVGRGAGDRDRASAEQALEAAASVRADFIRPPIARGLLGLDAHPSTGLRPSRSKSAAPSGAASRYRSSRRSDRRPIPVTHATAGVPGRVTSWRATTRSAVRSERRARGRGEGDWARPDGGRAKSARRERSVSSANSARPVDRSCQADEESRSCDSAKRARTEEPISRAARPGARAPATRTPLEHDRQSSPIQTETPPASIIS
jgi:hypothetical protein